MATVITFANQKGGVGKSETAKICSKFISSIKKTVITIDLDPQGNLTASYKAQQKYGTIYDVLTKNKPLLPCIQNTHMGKIVCSTPLLSGADKALAGVGSEFLIQEAIKDVVDLDYIVIDSPPALGLLTINALAATDYLVIPAQADSYSLQGIEQIMTTVEKVRKYCNPKLKVSGILLTRYNNRNNISQEMSKKFEIIAQKFGTKVFPKIRECTAVKEATARQIDLFSYAPKSNATVDYYNFLVEFFKGINNDEK